MRPASVTRSLELHSDTPWNTRGNTEGESRGNHRGGVNLRRSGGIGHENPDLARGPGGIEGESGDSQAGLAGARKEKAPGFRGLILERGTGFEHPCADLTQTLRVGGFG